MGAPALLPICPQCSGTGWRSVSQVGGPATVVACECRAAGQADAAAAAAQVPARYHHCTFADFQSSPKARGIDAALLVARNYAAEYYLLDRARCGLLFYGTVGTGKTHLAVAIVQQLIEQGVACRFADYRDVLKQIQATFDPTNPGTEAGVVAPLLRTDVLLLDDLGVGRATEWAQETLHYILNHRYSHNLATLITTNLEPGEGDGTNPHSGPHKEEGARVVAGTMPQLLGARLYSRLQEMCRWVPMHGTDFRARNRN